MRLPRRRSIVSSMPSSTGPLGAKTAIRRPSSRRAAARASQAARLSTRWSLVNRRPRPGPAIRKRLVTVRLPGARMAPISSSSARRQVRCCTNTGAKVRMGEAKRAGRCMATSLGGDVPVYRSPAPPPRPRRALRRCHACPEWPKSSEDTVGEVGRGGARGYTAAGPPRTPAMSLKPTPIEPVPEGTARVARAAFRKGNPLLKLRDELGTVFADADFADLFPKLGQPGLPPWRLALVTLLQFRENLPDRQAAEAVRA